MDKAIAITRKPLQLAAAHPADIARSVIVLACGAALIFAGQPLPL